MIALALLAPVAEPAVASDPGEEGESEHEGGTEAPVGDVEDLTPGQESTDVVDEDSPPLLAPGDPSDPNQGENEDGPVETEPPPDPDALAEGILGVPSPPPPTAPSPPPHATPPAPLTPSGEAPPSVAPAPRSKAAPVRRGDRRDQRGKSKTDRKRATRTPSEDRPARAAAPPRTEAKPVSPPRPRTTTPAASNPPPQASGPTYTVRAGDTLWAIAATRLGPGASAARIAREVQRLWALNARAIGTGDPSLLGVGVTLRLT